MSFVVNFFILGREQLIVTKFCMMVQICPGHVLSAVGGVTLGGSQNLKFWASE